MPSNKAVSQDDFMIKGAGSGWVKLNGKEYYFKPGRGTTESFNGEIYRFALGPNVITEMLPVVDDEGQVVGVLSEKITNGAELMERKKKYPNCPDLAVLTPDTKLKLQTGRLCGAMCALGEQNGNFGNQFVRQVEPEIKDASSFRSSIIDVDKSLGNVYAQKSKPINNFQLLDQPASFLHPDAQMLEVKSQPQNPNARQAFIEQAYFTYLTLALLDNETITQLADDHFQKSVDFQAHKWAVDNTNQFVGENFRNVLRQNPNFVNWLKSNAEKIEKDLEKHVTAFNEYKRNENPEKYAEDFMSLDKIKPLIESLTTKRNLIEQSELPQHAPKKSL